MSSAHEVATSEHLRDPRWRLIVSLAPLVLIGVLFIWQLAALSTYHVDYPIADDWQYYAPEPEYGMPDALTVEWLVHPAPWQ